MAQAPKGPIFITIENSIKDIGAANPFAGHKALLERLTAYNIPILPKSDLVLNEKLGSGAFMTVFRASCPGKFGDKPIAVKKINIAIPQGASDVTPYVQELTEQLAVASLELRVLSNPVLRHHPNIVGLLGVSWEDLPVQQCPELSSIPSFAPLIIVEQAHLLHPTLEDFYNHTAQNSQEIPMEDKVSLYCDVADALSALHTLGIIHGDIKPSNILIFEDHQAGRLVAKLSDFGGCQPSDKEPGFSYPLAGTKYWNAPEVDEPENPCFRRVYRDYFSLGLVGFFILFESNLFGSENKTAEELPRLYESKRNFKGIAFAVEKALRHLAAFVLREDAQAILATLPKSTDSLHALKDRLGTFRQLDRDGKVNL
jgi:serine/threonine protein kinase